MPKEFIPEPETPKTTRSKAEIAKENVQAELRESPTEIVLNEDEVGSEIGLG